MALDPGHKLKHTSRIVIKYCISLEGKCVVKNPGNYDNYFSLQGSKNRDVDFPMSVSTEPITLNEDTPEEVQVTVITDVQGQLIPLQAFCSAPMFPAPLLYCMLPSFTPAPCLLRSAVGKTHDLRSDL